MPRAEFEAALSAEGWSQDFATPVSYSTIRIIKEII